MLKGWRTILVNILPMLLIISDSLLAQGYLLTIVTNDPVILMILIIGINIVNIFLRIYTDTKIGSKE